MLAILAFSTKGSLKVDTKALPKISLIAIMGCCITPLLLFISYTHIPSGTATVFHFIYPAVVALGEFIFLKNKLKTGHIISAVICIAGIALFYNPTNQINLTGSFYALLSGITYATYIILLSSFKQKNISAFTFSFYVASICSVAMFFVCILTGQLSLPQSVSGWLLVVLFAFSLNVGAVVLFQKGTFLIGGSRASILSTFEPITSILAGAVIFSETLGILTIIGTVLVVSASILIPVFDMYEVKRLKQNQHF
jgi:drug/metabolite transporter (DMT)-like permease